MSEFLAELVLLYKPPNVAPLSEKHESNDRGFSYQMTTRNSAVAVIADRTAHDVLRILANYQTGFGFKLMNGWYARSDSTGRVNERTQTQST